MQSLPTSHSPPDDRHSPPRRPKMASKKSSSKKNSKSSAAGPKASQKRAAEQREHAGTAHTAHEESKWLQGGRIAPRRIDGTESAADLIDNTFLAYNAARLREACQL